MHSDKSSCYYFYRLNVCPVGARILSTAFLQPARRFVDETDKTEQGDAHSDPERDSEGEDFELLQNTRQMEGDI